MSENTTTNKIMLSHLGNLDENDLQYIRKELENSDIEFKYLSTTGQITNSVDDFSLHTFYILASPIIGELIKHVGKNIVWESLKLVFAYTKDRVKSQKVNKATPSGVTELPLKFGVHAILDKNTSFNFEISCDSNNEHFNENVDKILDFLREQTPKDKFELTSRVTFSEKDGEWHSESIYEYARKKVKEN
ncbi:hypothetical protein EH151_10025 [Elizabethkingia anophelis]|uniref:hypothetical protein n=1 Tax=Elizabethkingia anophelis TaxID=1117645 RepID=UPI0013691497|nr:hypothetical protein [Elizabethkingia anophelis]MDV3753428.1 hypothetical protein [Elizabethkingia anophelis]MYZ60225.1 hypothetical protein [Elizabethkingia anophelis]